MRTLLVNLLLISISAVGCAAHERYAYVNDVSVRSSLDLGYDVVAVDGMPVKRAAGKIATVVPVALVEPGMHTFTFQAEDPGNAAVSVSATVESDKAYRLAMRDGEFALVEHTD